MLIKVLKNKNGFSLIEVLVVCSVMAIAGLGIAEMFVNMAKQQKIARSKSDALQLQVSIQSAAADPAMILNSSTR